MIQQKTTLIKYQRHQIRRDPVDHPAKDNMQMFTLSPVMHAEIMLELLSTREVKMRAYALMLFVWDMLVVPLQLNRSYCGTPVQTVVLAGPVLELFVSSKSNIFLFFPQDNDLSSKNNVSRCGWEAQSDPTAYAA